MLARLVILALALPAMALAADAPAPTQKITVVGPPPAQPAASTAAATPTASPAQTAWALPPDPAECRIACAQANYFCRASDHPDDCAPTWSQCVTTCTLPSLDTGVSTAP